MRDAAPQSTPSKAAGLGRRAARASSLDVVLEGGDQAVLVRVRVRVRVRDRDRDRDRDRVER